MLIKSILLMIGFILTTLFNSLFGIYSTLANPAPTNSSPPAAAQKVALSNTSKGERHAKPNLRKLPKVQNPAVSDTSNEVKIVAGDSGVSAVSVQRAAQVVRDLSLPVIKQTMNQAPTHSAEIGLFSSRSSLANALLQAGVSPSQIPALVSETGGITVDSEIWIPLYALEDKSDLANVLTHELTHVVFNQMGIGSKLPVWLNEGLAWYDGLNAKKQVNPFKTKLEMAALNSSVVQAAQAGELYSLDASEQQILNAPYNVEYEDYLAVQYLIQQYSLAKIQAFLQQLTVQGLEQSFQNQFKTTPGKFANSFYRSL